MKQIKFPEQMFKRALTKCESFKQLVSILNDRMKYFEHYTNAIRIECSVYFDVVFKYHHVDWPDEEDTYTYKFSMIAKDTILGNVSNYKKALLSLFTMHFKDSFDRGDLCWFHKIDSIHIKDYEYSMHINNLMAWSKDTVGVFWVEQECGEHWIILPKEPEQKISTILRLTE